MRTKDSETALTPGTSQSNWSILNSQEGPKERACGATRNHRKCLAAKIAANSGLSKSDVQWAIAEST